MRHICFSLLIICCPVVSVSLLSLSLLDEGGEAPPPGEAVDTEKPVAVKTRIKKVSPGVYTSEVCTLARYVCGYNITWFSPWYNCTGWLGVKHQLIYISWFWALRSRSWLERPPGWEISPEILHHCCTVSNGKIASKLSWHKQCYTYTHSLCLTCTHACSYMIQTFLLNLC